MLILDSSLNNVGKPEQPEVLLYMREAKRLGVSVFEGDLWALPYIFRLEMNACLDAEQEQINILRINAKLAAEFADGQQERQTTIHSGMV